MNDVKRYNKKLLESSILKTATTYNNIGLVYHNMGKYEKALEYYERSLKIRLVTIGE